MGIISDNLYLNRRKILKKYIEEKKYRFLVRAYGFENIFWGQFYEFSVENACADMYDLFEIEVHVGARLVVKADGADVVVGDAVFRAGQGNEALVGQVGVIHDHVVVGVGHDGVALRHVDLLHLLGGKLSVGNRCMRMHICLIKFSFIRYKILFHFFLPFFV